MLRAEGASPSFDQVKIYTKTGDDGETGLFGGGRVPKDDTRVQAYGDVDELNAAIGMALACEPASLESAALEAIQRDLFAIGGQLASPDPAKVAKALAKAKLADARIGELERAIDQFDTELEALTAFILPGGTAKAASLHFARTVCRRAERSVVALRRHGGAVPPVILVYLNRLSDWLFTLARVANHRAHHPDRIW